MNHYHTTANTTNISGSAEICYISPRGHYYVAKHGLDTRFVRNVQLVNRYQAAFAAGKMSTETLSQLESLTKRAIGA